MCNEHINFHIADAYNIISILVSKLCQLFFPPSITNNNKVSMNHEVDFNTEKERKNKEMVCVCVCVCERERERERERKREREREKRKEKKG